MASQGSRMDSTMTYAADIGSRVEAASPARGRSIAGAVGKSIDQLHVAVREATAAAKNCDFHPAWLATGSKRDTLPFQGTFERVGWAMVAVALCEAQLSEEPISIERALHWFGSEVPAANLPSADRALAEVRRTSPDLVSLFPYLLDTFGRTSRLDVIRDHSLKGQRQARKEVGSFYTPADVAFFMAASIANGDSQRVAPQSCYWFDPACGSGVFLIAALRAVAQRQPDIDVITFASSYLLATDISPQACDFAAFAIVNELATSKLSSPVSLWCALRQNIIALDALQFASAGRRSFDEHFPQIRGPLRLLCNPPYVRNGSHGLSGAGASRALYLPFVEMMWKVASGDDDASAIVAPLALASNLSADHKRCRAELSAKGGAWTMLFFDRQPHAIFGEEAKTRAVVAIRRPGPTPAEIKTSGLLKWTSKQRSSIFTEERAVSLGQVPVARLVPKLGSVDEATLYRTLQKYRFRSPHRPDISKAAPSEIVGNVLSTDVFVGGTAYNFLNVFRNYPDHLSWRGELSTSGIHKLSFGESHRADAATAILASRISFWLWHVVCDGFHVPAWFISEFPLFDVEFTDSQLQQLASLGQQAWEGLQRDLVLSLNRDKITFAFRPTEISDIRTKIDLLLLDAIGASSSLTDSLHDFEFRTVSIDGAKRTALPPKSVTIDERGVHASVD